MCRVVFPPQKSVTFLKKEVLAHAAAWTNLEDIMLSEARQSQKDRYWMTQLWEVMKKVARLLETESRMLVASLEVGERT